MLHRAFLILFLLAASLATGSASVIYSALDLGPVQATSINNSGDVTGIYMVNGVSRVFVYSGGLFSILPNPQNGWISGTVNGPMINDAKQIAGTIALNSGLRAFLYNGGIYQELTPGYSEAYSINSNGVVAGAVLNGSQLLPATFSNGQTTILFNQPSTVAFAINDSGQVAGMNVQTNQGFVYSGGNVQNLGPLYFKDQMGINNGGIAAASRRIVPGVSRPTVFTYSNGSISDLGTVAGASASIFRDINNQGNIVGYSAVGLETAILYSGGQWIDLNSVAPSCGTHLDLAMAINDAGVIVAQSSAGRSFLLTPGGNSCGQADLTSLFAAAAGGTPGGGGVTPPGGISPVPEPSPAILLTVGLLALIIRARRMGLQARPHGIIILQCSRAQKLAPTRSSRVSAKAVWAKYTKPGTHASIAP